MAIKYGPSKSWDYGYEDGVNGLPKLSSASMYAGGYSAGRDFFRRRGGRPTQRAVEEGPPVPRSERGWRAKKTLGYARSAQQRRVNIGARYS